MPLDRATLGPAPSPYARAPERELGPWLLSVALLLALADLLIGYVMRGLTPRLRGPATAAAVALLLLTPARPGLLAAEGDDRLAELANETHLAYVITGDAAVDQESEAGLDRADPRPRASAPRSRPPSRSAVDFGQGRAGPVPAALLADPARPPRPRRPRPCADVRRLPAPRRHDPVRHQGRRRPPAGPGRGRPRRAAPGRAPARASTCRRSTRCPSDHALTRAFYLLQDFPGRWAGQPVWVDQAAPGVNDGVSGVIIGAHDWAGAWAEDGNGDALLPGARRAVRTSARWPAASGSTS